jgi:hypothetical protein
MIATITFDNIFSGLIGSLVGCSFALIAGRLAARRESIDRLRALLLELGKRLYFEGDAPKVVESRYEAICEACLTVEARLLTPWRRARLRKLWYGLVGHDPRTFARYCHVIPPLEVAKTGVHELLDFIGCKYPQPPENAKPAPTSPSSASRTISHASHMSGTPAQPGSPRFALWLCVLSPAVFLIAFLSLAAHVRLSLGHWPTPMIESFGGSAYAMLAGVVIWVGFFAVFLAIPLWLMMLCFRACRGTLSLHLIQLGVYAASWGIIALYAHCDPGRFVEWFLD